jgi:hypothetical protein
MVRFGVKTRSIPQADQKIPAVRTLDHMPRDRIETLEFQPTGVQMFEISISGAIGPACGRGHDEIDPWSSRDKLDKGEEWLRS